MNFEARVTKLEEVKNGLVGLGTLTIVGPEGENQDKIFLNNVQIRQTEKDGKEEIFVAFPSYKHPTRTNAATGKPEYINYYNPVTAEAREVMIDCVKTAYQNAVTSPMKTATAKAELSGVTNDIVVSASDRKNGLWVNTEGDRIMGSGTVVVNGVIALNSVTIVQGEENKFASFPGYATNRTDQEGNVIYQKYYNMTREVHDRINDVMVKAYEAKVAKLDGKSKTQSR